MKPATLDDLNNISWDVIGSAIAVQGALGVGVLESVYRSSVALELEGRGRKVAEEVPLPVTYGGRTFEKAFRPDLVVDDAVVVELKAVQDIAPAHEAQLLTYLRLGGYPLGLLVNFGTYPVRKGIRRFVGPTFKDYARQKESD